MSGELLLRVFVPGRPRTKGSLKPILVRGAGGRVRASLTENNPESTAWKKTMMRALAAQWRGLPHNGPVEVHAFFRFQQQPAVGGGAVPSQAGEWPTAVAIGDVDKLWRNVLDALTQAHVLADDSLVIGGMPYKRWCRPGEKPGVLIVVTAANDVGAVCSLEAVCEEIS